MSQLQIKFFLPLIGWCALIFISSSIPGTSLPPLDMWSADKLIHSAVFGILAFFSSRAFAHYGQERQRSRRWAVSWSLVFCLVYALSDEFHQMYVPNRQASAFDLMADAIGIIMIHSYVWFIRK